MMMVRCNTMPMPDEEFERSSAGDAVVNKVESMVRCKTMACTDKKKEEYKVLVTHANPVAGTKVVMEEREGGAAPAADGRCCREALNGVRVDGRRCYAVRSGAQAVSLLS